jgi:hypothetical protein
MMQGSPISKTLSLDSWDRVKGIKPRFPLLFSPGFPAILWPVVAKVYIVSRRPSKFIVLEDNM